MTNNASTQTIKHKSRQSILWYTTVPFALHFLRFASSILLARILDPADFGVMGIAAFILYYCNSVTEFGLAKAIVQRKVAEPDHYNAYFCFNLFISIVLFIVFQLTSGYVADFFNESVIEDALEVYAIMFLISAFIAVPQAKLKRELSYKALAIIEAAKVMCSISISLSLALNGFGLWSLIYSVLIAQALALLLTKRAAHMRYALVFKMPYFKSLLRFGAWDFFWGQMKLIGDNIDKLILGKVLGVTALGFYDKAIGLARMPNEQFSNRLSSVSFSTFSRLQENPEEVHDSFTKMMVVNATVIFPLFVGLAAVSENFTLVLLGEKWLPMVSSLAILSITYLIASLTSPIVSMNSALGYIKQQSLVRFAAVVMLIIGLIQFAPLGIEAASYTLLAFYIVLLLLSYVLMRRKLSISIGTVLGSFFPPFIASLVMFFGVELIQTQVLQSSAVLNLLAAIGVGFVSYGLCFLIFPFRQWGFLRTKVINTMLAKLR